MEKKLDAYYIQRILPSFVVSFGLSLFKLSKSSIEIIKAFQLYNLVLLLFCTFIWHEIAKMYSLNLKMIWLGFILWFLNYGIAENSFYYPVLTDVTAFFLGFSLMYSYLRNYSILVIIITFFGAFTWPTLIYLGVLLIIFPVDFKINSNLMNLKKISLKKRSFIFLLPIPVLLVALYYSRKYINIGVIKMVDTEIITSTLYLSAILNYCVMTYFFIVILPDNLSLKNYIQLLKKIFVSIKIKNVLIVVTLVSLILLIQNYLSNDSIQYSNLLLMFYYISIYGATKPLVFAVSIINYFGTGFILYFFFLKYFRPHLCKIGIGVYFFFMASFLIFFTTEARHMIEMLPFIILLLILILKEVKISRLTFILIVFSSLILSKTYIPMQNTPGYKSFLFPGQLYFMNTFVLSTEAYIILGSVITLISVILFVALRKNNMGLPFLERTEIEGLR